MDLSALASGTFPLALGCLVAALGFRLLARGRPLGEDLRYSVVFLAVASAMLAAQSLIPGWTSSRSLTAVALMLLAVGAVRLGESVLVAFLRTSRGMDVPRILRDLVAFLLYAVALAAVLRATLQIDLGSLVATSAVLSVIIGLALQETLGHLFSGLALSIEKPFQVSDWITAGPHTGRVIEMTWRSTKLQTFEDDLVVVPNGLIAKEIVRNYSRPTTTHARVLEVGVVYGAAPNTVKDAIRWVLRENHRVLSDPAPEVQVVNFGDFAITYRIRFWIPGFAQHRFIEDEIMSGLWYKLRRESIGIPFPIRDVNVRMISDTEAREEYERRVAEAQHLLSAVYFVSVLPLEVRHALARRTRSERFGIGERIIHQGAAGETFYLLAQGEVDVHVTGTEQPVAHLARGDHFGEMSLLTGEPRSATVVAATDVVLLVLDRAAFADLLAADPSVAQVLCDALARRRGELEAVHTMQQAAAATAPMASNRIFDKLREIFKLR